jgi:hypothetical protein
VGTARHLAVAIRTRQDLLWVRAGFAGTRASLAIAATKSSIPIAVCSSRIAMIPGEILKKIRQIEFRTNRIVNV